MENCKTCEHSVFDKKYGEYKCNKLERRIYILLESSECRFYKKQTKKKEESKTQADLDGELMESFDYYL